MINTTINGYLPSFRLLLSALLCLITTGCITQVPQESDAQAALLEPNKPEVKYRLLQQYQSWQGVRYRYGGTTKQGVDCSAFVQITFRDQFGIEIPRTTGEQHRIGEKVPQTQLKVGDLILFKTSPQTNHVGIYLGNNQFIHSSSSKGVTISALTNRYWLQRYQTARRVLEV